jgi:hypothetical protein
MNIARGRNFVIADYRANTGLFEPRGCGRIIQ